jgi:hypothetical protein
MKKQVNNTTKSLLKFKKISSFKKIIKKIYNRISYKLYGGSKITPSEFTSTNRKF